MALFGGEIDNSKTPYNLIEESLKQVKEKIFSGKFDTTEKSSNKSDEELLNEALENEDYETAAKLRDLINKKQK
jgi:protein-arginine kinase activator protein McsA